MEGEQKNHKKRQKYLLQIISSFLDNVTCQINLYPCILYPRVTARIRSILFKIIVIIDK